MARLVVLSVVLLLGCICVKESSSLLPRAKMLYSQAFRDGFWRGLAGDYAVVNYKPVHKGRLVYYYQVPKYYTKAGYPAYGHGVGHGHGGHGVGYGGHGVGHGVGHGGHGVGHGHGGHRHGYGHNLRTQQQHYGHTNLVGHSMYGVPPVKSYAHGHAYPATSYAHVTHHH